MIYLITCEETDTCKIGYSKDPYKRVAQLQTSNPFKLELKATLEGDTSYESYIHRKFGHCRLSGEWFRLNEEIKKFFNIFQNEKIASAKVFPISTNWKAMSLSELNIPGFEKDIFRVLPEKLHNTITAEVLFKHNIISIIEGYVNEENSIVMIFNPTLTEGANLLDYDDDFVFKNLNKKIK